MSRELPEDKEPPSSGPGQRRPTNLDTRPRPRKQKVAIACDRCRAKKIRCDGLKPVCQSCSKRSNGSEVCTWIHGLLRADVRASRDQISRLQRQTQQPRHGDEDGGSPSGPYAAVALNLHDTVANFLHRQSSDFRVDTERNDHQDAAGMFSESMLLDGQASSHYRQQELTNTLTTSPVAGSATAMLGSVTDSDNIRGLFGSSSTGSFISLVRHAVDRKFGSSRPDITSSKRGVANTTTDGCDDNDVTALENPSYLLPPRQKADQLLAIYWRTTFPLYPLVDPDDLQQRYKNLWTAEDAHGVEPEFSAFINAIFALSTQTDTSVKPDQRSSLSKTYMHRAQALLNFWKPGSLQTVQTLLTLAHYLQTTNEPHQCWVSVGHAVRTAQSLGLHSLESTDYSYSPSQLELCRRIWHCCVLMDRYLAMTYGRPPGISNLAQATNKPLRVANQVLCRDIFPLNSVEDKILDFFIHSIDLFEILTEILQRLYAPISTSKMLARNDHRYCPNPDSHISAALFLDIDQRLAAWEAALPRHLQYDPAELSNISQQSALAGQAVLIRQSTILRQRFLHVRILSLRPMLARFVAQEMDDSDEFSCAANLSQRFTQLCAIVCVRVAQEAIDVVHQNLSRPWDTTGVTATWWYNVFYVYSAATVLIAARLKASISSEITQEAISRSYKHAIEILEGYGSFNELMPKLVTTLQMLFDEVPLRYANYRKQVSQGDCSTLDQSHRRSENEGIIGRNVDRGSNTAHTTATTGMFPSNELPSDLEGCLFNPVDLSWLNATPFDINWRVE